MTTAADIAQKHNLRRRNGRHVGPCPKCGGSSTSDKFVMRDDGGFKCYTCDFKGDLITWLRQMDGLSCPEAHQVLGKACTAPGCPVYATCRQGAGATGQRPTYRPAPVQTAISSAEKTQRTTAIRTPAQIWQTWAADLVAKAHQALADQPEQRRWLAARGVTASAIARHKLGWLARSSNIERTAIGLEPSDEKPTLWIPAGLVIPIFDDNGQIHRLRIRRPPQERERFLPDLKYVWIQGSGTAPLVIRPQGDTKARGALIVEAELDAIACAAAHPEIIAVALGTVSAPLSDQLHQQLAELPTILVALDADPGTPEKPGAGPAAIAAWRNHHRHARYWPVPCAKDPGEYAAQPGADLRSWIESGLLPPVAAPMTSPAPRAEPCPLPGVNRGAGGGDPGQDPIYGTRQLSTGQVIDYIVCHTRGQHRRLIQQHPGVAVVGFREFKRIVPAAAEIVLQLKSVFQGCEVISTRDLTPKKDNP